ncbi:hypothetical protein [Tenacibaculum amylolyticum]|uniref:hypothetical protein n=1 Tax=Tenacibaculum amylolyticum TaxID=104269 RepID=UPI0038960C88
MLNEIQKLGTELTKVKQQSINGGGIPVICRVLCPSYCHCAGQRYDQCAYPDGRHCHAL